MTGVGPCRVPPEIPTEEPRPPRSRFGRRRLGQVLTELHYQIRTEGGTPGRNAGAVALGTFVGCTPLWGVHLVLCAALARLFGLSRLKTYLAAHINNPLTAPWLLYLELGVGHLLFAGRWPSLTPSQLKALSIWDLGRDVLAGSLVVGAVLGVGLGAAAYGVARRWQRSSAATKLIDRTSRRYLETGVLHWEFVRGKLKHDPVYFELVTSGILPTGGRLLDLGCGRGVALSLIRQARTAYEEGEWEAGWSEPPVRLEMQGVERREKLARVARLAVDADIPIECGDATASDLPRSDVILLLDVLHYLAPEDQESLIGRAAQSLTEDGSLIIREADASRGWRFRLTRWGERLNAICRLAPRQRFHYRAAASWRRLLASHGLSTSSVPSWRGTPYANMLIRGRRAGAARS